MEKPISAIDMFKDMAEGLFVDKQAEEDLNSRWSAARAFAAGASESRGSRRGELVDKAQ